MRKRILAIMIPFISPLPGVSFSESITFVPSISYQNKQLDFDQTYSGNASNKAEFSVQLPVLNFSLTTIFQGRFFVAMKVEKSVVDISSTTSETDRSAISSGPQANLIAIAGSKVDVDRTDASITFGMRAAENLNIFAGYLNGETTLTPHPFCANPHNSVLSDDNEVIAAPCTASNKAYVQYDLGTRLYDPDHPAHRNYKQTYSENGFFVGTSYSFPFEGRGTLSASIAYASMDGSYQDNFSDPAQRWYADLDGDDVKETPTHFPFDYEGDTTGTSIGLTWTGSVGDNTAYTLDIRRQEYSMSGKDQTGRLSGVFLDTKEVMLGVSIGIQMYF